MIWRRGRRGATEMTGLVRLSWIAFALAAAQVVVGIGMSVIGNTEGVLGGVLFALMYALPLALTGLALRSPHPTVLAAAGWAALLLSALYSLVVVANWSGYTAGLATFALAITAPTVVVDIAIFWATVLHRTGPQPTP